MAEASGTAANAPSKKVTDHINHLEREHLILEKNIHIEAARNDRLDRDIRALMDAITAERRRMCEFGGKRSHLSGLGANELHKELLATRLRRIKFLGEVIHRLRLRRDACNEDAANFARRIDKLRRDRLQALGVFQRKQSHLEMTRHKLALMLEASNAAEAERQANHDRRMTAIREAEVERRAYETERDTLTREAYLIMKRLGERGPNRQASFADLAAGTATPTPAGSGDAPPGLDETSDADAHAVAGGTAGAVPASPPMSPQLQPPAAVAVSGSVTLRSGSLTLPAGGSASSDPASPEGGSALLPSSAASSSGSSIILAGSRRRSTIEYIGELTISQEEALKREIAALNEVVHTLESQVNELGDDIASHESAFEKLTATLGVSSWQEALEHWQEQESEQMGIVRRINMIDDEIAAYEERLASTERDSRRYRREQRRAAAGRRLELNHRQRAAAILRSEGDALEANTVIAHRVLEVICRVVDRAFVSAGCDTLPTFRHALASIRASSREASFASIATLRGADSPETNRGARDGSARRSSLFRTGRLRPAERERLERLLDVYGREDSDGEGDGKRRGEGKSADDDDDYDLDGAAAPALMDQDGKDAEDRSATPQLKPGAKAARQPAFLTSGPADQSSGKEDESAPADAAAAAGGSGSARARQSGRGSPSPPPHRSQARPPPPRPARSDSLRRSRRTLQRIFAEEPTAHDAAETLTAEHDMLHMLRTGVTPETIIMFMGVVEQTVAKLCYLLSKHHPLDLHPGSTLRSAGLVRIAGRRPSVPIVPLVPSPDTVLLNAEFESHNSASPSHSRSGAAGVGRPASPASQTSGILRPATAASAGSGSRRSGGRRVALPDDSPTSASSASPQGIAVRRKRQSLADKFHVHPPSIHWRRGRTRAEREAEVLAQLSSYARKGVDIPDSAIRQVIRAARREAGTGASGATDDSETPSSEDDDEEYDDDVGGYTSQPNAGDDDYADNDDFDDDADVWRQPSAATHAVPLTSVSGSTPAVATPGSAPSGAFIVPGTAGALPAIGSSLAPGIGYRRVSIGGSAPNSSAAVHAQVAAAAVASATAAGAGTRGRSPTEDGGRSQGTSPGPSAASVSGDGASPSPLRGAPTAQPHSSQLRRVASRHLVTANAGSHSPLAAPVVAPLAPSLGDDLSLGGGAAGASANGDMTSVLAQGGPNVGAPRKVLSPLDAVGGVAALDRPSRGLVDRAGSKRDILETQRARDTLLRDRTGSIGGPAPSAAGGSSSGSGPSPTMTGVAAAGSSSPVAGGHANARARSGTIGSVTGGRGGRSMSDLGIGPAAPGSPLPGMLESHIDSVYEEGSGYGRGGFGGDEDDDGPEGNEPPTGRTTDSESEIAPRRRFAATTALSPVTVVVPTPAVGMASRGVDFGAGGAGLETLDGGVPLDGNARDRDRRGMIDGVTGRLVVVSGGVNSGAAGARSTKGKKRRTTKGRAKKVARPGTGGLTAAAAGPAISTFVPAPAPVAAAAPMAETRPVGERPLMLVSKPTFHLGHGVRHLSMDLDVPTPIAGGGAESGSEGGDGEDDDAYSFDGEQPARRHRSSDTGAGGASSAAHGGSGGASGAEQQQPLSGRRGTWEQRGDLAGRMGGADAVRAQAEGSVAQLAVEARERLRASRDETQMQRAPKPLYAVFDPVTGAAGGVAERGQSSDGKKRPTSTGADRRTPKASQTASLPDLWATADDGSAGITASSRHPVSKPSAGSTTPKAAARKDSATHRDKPIKPAVERLAEPLNRLSASDAARANMDLATIEQAMARRERRIGRAAGDVDNTAATSTSTIGRARRADPHGAPGAALGSLALGSSPHTHAAGSRHRHGASKSGTASSGAGRGLAALSAVGAGIAEDVVERDIAAMLAAVRQRKAATQGVVVPGGGMPPGAAPGGGSWDLGMSASMPALAAYPAATGGPAASSLDAFARPGSRGAVIASGGYSLGAPSSPPGPDMHASMALGNSLMMPSSILSSSLYGGSSALSPSPAPARRR